MCGSWEHLKVSLGAQGPMILTLFARFQFTFTLLKLGSECSFPAPKPELQSSIWVSRFIHHLPNFPLGLSGREKQISLREPKPDMCVNNVKAVSAWRRSKEGVETCVVRERGEGRSLGRLLRGAGIWAKPSAPTARSWKQTWHRGNLDLESQACFSQLGGSGQVSSTFCLQNGGEVMIVPNSRSYHRIN